MRKPKRINKKPKPPKEEWTTKPIDGGSGKGPMPPDNSDLRRRIEENPGAVAAEAKYKLHEVQAGYRRELYAVLAMIYGIARHFSMNYPAWRTFFNQPFFQDGKIKRKARKHHDQALRHTMNFVFDVKSKQVRNRTGKYAAALRDYMLIGVPAHIVAAEIEKDGGIEALYQEYLEKEAGKPKRGPNRPRTDEQYTAMTQYCNLDEERVSAPKDMTFSDLEDGGSPADEKQDDLDRIDGKGQKEGDDPLDIYDEADFGLGSTVKRGLDPDGRPTIEFEMSEARQERFLDLLKGRAAVVHVTSLGRSKDGWRRIKVDKVTWKSRRTSL